MSPSHDLVVGWLSARIAEMLGFDPGDIDCATPFVDVGLSSIQAVELSGDIERWTGLTLSPTLAFDYPTIEGVAEHVVDRMEFARRTVVAQGVSQ